LARSPQPDPNPRGAVKKLPGRNSVTYGITNYKAIKESNSRTDKDPDDRRFEHPNSWRSEDTEPRSTKAPELQRSKGWYEQSP